MRKSHKGLDSRRLTSLSLATLVPDYLAMECLRHRREDLEVGKKNMAHLTDTFYTRAPVSPRTAPPCSSLDPCKPLTCSNRAQSSFLIQHTQGQLLHPRQSHKPAPSRSSGASSCLLCELEVWALSLPRFLLPLSSSPPFSLGPTQLPGIDVSVIYCSPAAGLNSASGFSACDSGGMRNWTSSVLMATLSG